jgi:tetratricopeptide (TPR) repeat protein
MGALQMKLSRPFLLAATLLCLPLTQGHAEKPRVYTATPLNAGVAYNQRARDAYAAGVWTLEEAESEQTIENSLDQRRAYARALRAFAEAINAERSMYEAHTYIGYVNRKLGNYSESLRAYDTALNLKPDYIFAIEYQGEAYLALGNFARTKFNYLRLYALDRKLANKLLEEMQAWLRTPEGRESKDAHAARAWVAERVRP